MASLSNTDSLPIALHCEQCVTFCADAQAENSPEGARCPDCHETLKVYVRTSARDGIRLETFCANELHHCRIEHPLALLADLARKSEQGTHYSITCAALAATALGCAQRCSASGELDLAFRLSKGVLAILPDLPEAMDLAKRTSASLVAELLPQARSSHQCSHWKKLTSLCDLILEVAADNAEARGLLGKARELHADNLVESAQQHLDIREYDAALRLAREALELVPESLAAQELIRTTLDARVADILGRAGECCSRKDWANASTLCNEALKILPGNVAASELMKKVHGLYIKSVVDRAQECLGRGEFDEALALCNTLEAHYSTKFERCGQIRHDVCIALVGRSETAMSADDWQKAQTFAQKALELESGNSDAVRLRADAQGKLHLKELAARAFAAYRSKDLAGCKTACEAFLTYQAGCGTHLHFTNAGADIDFNELPKILIAEINVETRIRRIMAAIRIFKWAAGCVAVLLLITSIWFWRKSVFNKRVRAFEGAMQAKSYDTARTFALDIAGKYHPAAHLLEYLAARASFETALGGANDSLLKQYGGNKWANFQAEKQAAEANACAPTKGVEAYRRAVALLTECQAMAEVGEKARQEIEVREKAIAEAKAKEKREQTERRRAQEEKDADDGILRTRVKSDLNTVIASVREASSGSRRLDARVVSAQEDLRTAANRGWPDAQVLCGLCYMFGLAGFEKDRDEAVILFRKAANQGNAYAQYHLGMAYGEDRDAETAAKWFWQAADQGLAEAQFMLGTMYAEGTGVLKNEVTAVDWWRKAAEQNHIYAQNNLGQFYAFGGAEVPLDRKEAEKWLRKAASAGIIDAVKTLMEMSVPPIGWLYKCSRCGRVEKYTRKVAVAVCSQCIQGDMQYVGPAY